MTTPAANDKRIPQKELHFVLHHIVLQDIAIQRRLQHAGLPQPQYRRSPHVIYQYFKSFRLRKRLSAKGLCLLQTKFARKPKNPV